MAKSYSMNPEPVRYSAIAPAIALIVALAPVPAWIVDDFYSRDMYAWLQHMMTTATNVLPFALLDVWLVLTTVFVLRRAYLLFHVMRQRGPIDALWEATRRVVRAFSILVILFLWAWGFNYRRLPLETAVPGGVPAAPAAEALRVAFIDSAALAARLRPIVQPEGRFHSIALELRDPMNAALRSLSREPLKTFSEPKYSLVLTPFFNSAGVTGMLNPLGLETIVLPDLLPYERPFVVAHEWAHLSGHADEAEASAIGWLACMKGDPTLAYSASLYLMMESGSELPVEIRRDLMTKVDAGVRADIDAIMARMRQERPAVQRTASRVYDEYLRANRVADGNASYSRALRLIVSPKFREALAGYTISR
jgi:hypothetical protein